ncbi:hypothetical protein TNIN_122461 [Trichonephila inaurata madagascariensis]|uniref:Uncharacterized protein n=1 Tax=Trichonephila inaurata madagascariensis TaxID=2747483 RepID=A0A8X7CBM7_9ARAC|nr:hypothetical protein TNIN_122461 [Trichonephila inaurata madagascariensis]
MRQERPTFNYTRSCPDFRASGVFEALGIVFNQRAPSPNWNPGLESAFSSPASFCLFLLLIKPHITRGRREDLQVGSLSSEKELVMFGSKVSFPRCQRATTRLLPFY